MEFLVQHYSSGVCGWVTLNGEVHYNLYLHSQMHRLYTSGERACLYDRVERVNGKDCHTFFLLSNNDTFDGVDQAADYTFGGNKPTDGNMPTSWFNTFYNQAQEIPKVSSTKYSFTGKDGRSVTDFRKGDTIPRTPIEGYMCFGIISPKGETVTTPGKWYRKNGSWSFTDVSLNKLQYNKYDNMGGLPLYYDENDQYSPGNVFNSGVYGIIVKSGKSLGTLLTEISEGTALDDYLLDYIVGSGTTGDIDRNQNSPVNTASYTLVSAQTQTYAGIPGLTYKGGNRAYDGGWIFYNIYVTQSLQYAHDYIDNGTPPPDAYKNTINTDGSKNIDPKFSTPKDKGDSDDPTEPDDKDNSKRDSQTIKLPRENGVSSPSNNWYQMTRDQLHRFIYYFWNDIGKNVTDWFNDIQGLYNNLSEAVLGVKYFPCSSSWLYEVETGQPPFITIGRYNTNFQATQIKSNAKLTKIGSYAIYERYKNFLDYTATRIEVFLPYMGWVELPTQKVMGTKIIVYFGVDMATTQGMYVIKSNGMIVFQSTFNFGITIPITLSSSVEEVKSAVNTGVSLASSALSVAMASTVSPVAGGMLAVSSAQNLIPQGYDSLHMIGNATANSGQLGGKRCAICITRSIPKQPGLYGSRIGFCYNKKKQLAQLSGFTVIENPRIDSTGYATEQEVEEIYSLMRKGIIL